MTAAEERQWLIERVRFAYETAGLPWPDDAHRGPVRLDRLMESFQLRHNELSGLTRTAALQFMARCGAQPPDLEADETPLSGFIWANQGGGFILVSADDPVTRRRFSAAHEFGHFLLHLPAASPEGRLFDDATEVMKTAEDQPGELTTALMERQADRFAAELLMPEVVCRRLHAGYVTRFGKNERFLEHHLASDLLVSREAMHWRLHGLRLADPVAGLRLLTEQS